MKNFKKTTLILIVCIAAIALLAGCTGTPAPSPSALPGTSPAATAPAPEATPVASAASSATLPATPTPVPKPTLTQAQSDALGFVGLVMAVNGKSVTVQVLPLSLNQNGPTQSDAGKTKTFDIPDGVKITDTQTSADISASGLKIGNVLMVHYGSDGKTIEKIDVQQKMTSVGQ